MKRLLFAFSVFSIINAGFAHGAEPERTRGLPDEGSKSLVRGGIVFRHYCALCHGESGSGQARATKLYGQTRLIIRPTTPERYEKIVRTGSADGNAPTLMPPWQDELSEEQINDVVSYLVVIGSAVARGEAVFQANCILCHGVYADGKGRASALFNPPPANLTISDKTDDYKLSIITKGGAAMGRSAMMPPWGLQLSEQEIADVVSYLRTVLAPKVPVVPSR